MGSSFLRKLQVVKQAGYGTYATDLASPTTGVIPTGFKGDYHDMTEFQDPGEEEYNGDLAPTGRPIMVSDFCEFPFDGDLTFENVDYLLSSGWQSKVTGTLNGSLYTRQYSAPAAGSANVPLLATVLAGDDAVAGGKGYGGSDCFIPSLEISAARGAGTKASGSYSGHTLRQLQTSEYSNITSSRLGGTSIPAWLWQLYIDDSTGSVGTTQKKGTLIDWSLKVTSGFHHKQFLGEGVVSPTNYGQNRPEITLDFTFEQNAIALAELVKFETNTPRLIALTATLGSKYIQLYHWGWYTSFDKPSDSDGNTTLSASFKCKKIPGLTGYWQANTNTAAAALFS